MFLFFLPWSPLLLSLPSPFIGDFFVVQIASDPVFGTPVFTTISGESQCPAETSTLAREGNVVIESMTPLCGDNRDAPCAQLACNQPAHFRVRIRNKSPTGNNISMALIFIPLPPFLPPYTILFIYVPLPPSFSLLFHFPLCVLFTR